MHYRIFNITCLANQYNFGQRLQTYALQKYIKQEFDVDVFTVDLRKPPFDFNAFENECMNMLKAEDMRNIDFNKTDTIIVGGDQVIVNDFLKGQTSFNYLCPKYMSKAKLVSYASSANGMIYRSKDHKNYKFVVDCLKNFKMLGFREKLDADSYKKCSAQTITHNIDPIFLLTTEEWQQIMKKPSVISDSELFDFEYYPDIAYQQDVFTTQADGIKKLILYVNNDKHNSLVQDPREFLWCIKHCRNFNTTSYHGNAFGIMFRKNIVFPDKRTYSFKKYFFGTTRIDSLLDLVGVKIENSKIINYEQICKNINDQRRRSYNWLKECLSCKDFKYACYAKDCNVRSKSVSGGMSALLAKYCIENGGLVYGASYSNDFKSVKIVKVSAIEDYFSKISKSKYNYCQMPNITEVRQDLDTGKLVLFTGCPCQIKVLKTQLRKDYENLITVDLLCNGYSRPEFLEKFVEEQEKLEESKIVCLDMRPKHCFGLYMKFENGKEKILQNIVTNTFVCNKQNYMSECLSCNMHFAGNSAADLTIGDFWDYSKYKNVCDQQFDPKLGTNVIYVNTEKGRMLFNSLKSQLEWRYLI